MVLIKHILLFFLLSVMALPVLAQVPKKSKIPEQKFIPPKVKTYWGRQTDSAVVSKEEVLQMLAAPIRVADDKKVAYTITSYQFLYRRKAMTEDEQTGKAIPTQSIVSNLFRVTPLPELWRNTISEQLQSGEELHYFDIIVKDSKGKLFFAPELKIKIK